MAEAKILVVEDERIVALHLKQQLVRLGYQVAAVVASGDRALQQVAESQPDVVLMDIHIEGGMDGIETAKLIPPELRIPVIYLTAYSDEDTLRRARDTTPYGYLLKPFTERELHATIQMVLARRSADRAVQENEQRLGRLVAERTADLVSANRQLEEQAAERLRVEQQLSQAQKMEAVGQLTGGIAHEINNVLMVVAGSFDLIRSAPSDVERVARCCEIAGRSTERGVRLIRQLLMFARRQVMFPEIVDLNRLITEFEVLLTRSAPESIEVMTRLAADIGSCRVDPAEFMAAIVNLVVNARDAISAHGRIVIETSNVTLAPDSVVDKPDLVSGSYVMVAVSDTGSGIHADVLPRVFEPFFTTKDVGKGSGLGLSQVYGFAKASGGHVTVYSEAGFGTTVRLYIPVSAGRQSEVEPRVLAVSAEAVPQGSTAPQGRTVLVVEDDEDLLEVTAGNLRALGYGLLIARDCAEALTILRSGRPIDILFSDVVLPGGMNGLQLAIAARQLRPTIKTLLTSGYTAAALAARDELVDKTPMLAKPYALDDLTYRLRSILGAA
jgi:signal transduction histidine kinase